MASSVLENKGKANNYGASTNLSLGVMFTAPSDGYVVCNTAGAYNASAAVEIYGRTQDDSYFRCGGNGNSTYATWPVFIRKGMRVKPYSMTNGGTVFFIPLQ